MPRGIRFGRWTGTQDPLGTDLTPDEVLDAIADELLDGTDPQQALRDLLRRGLAGRTAGLEELRRRVEAARRQELERMGLTGPLQEVAERLAEIEELERTALQFTDDEELWRDRTERLDSLPPDPAARIQALQEYPWVDAGAREAFEQLVEQLRRDVAEATFGQLAQALGQMDEAAIARLREFLADLNALVARQERGEDITEDFEAFKAKHRDLIPGDPATLDDLLEDMARRMAALSQLMAGLSPDQRAQLGSLAQQMLGDMGLSAEAQQLARSLQLRFPQLGWDQQVRGAPDVGPESGSLSATVDWMEHLRGYEDLAQALGQNYPGARLEDVDAEALSRLVGDESAADLRALREIEHLLEKSGAVQRRRGKLELTPRGVRRLGERSLERIFARALESQLGDHAAQSLGGEAEPTGSTRPWRFGDPFRIDVGHTIRNAVIRGGRRPEGGVQLAPDDFELAESEQRVRAVTVLLLDMSFSMPLRGNWESAKRLALALQALVASRFPQDRFHTIGFSDYARRLEPKDLLVSGWERVWGTNMQHAFQLARRLLTAEPSTERHVIMVTDGEPTAHLEGSESAFHWPPHPRTLQITMAEATRLARTGATLNVFLLDHDPGAAAFVETMVHRAGGRIFYPDLADLGNVVVRDFLSNRRR